MTPEQAMRPEAFGVAMAAAMTFWTSMVAVMSESVEKGVESHILNLSVLRTPEWRARYGLDVSELKIYLNTIFARGA
jgi:hypothetical protein